MKKLIFLHCIFLFILHYGTAMSSIGISVSAFPYISQNLNLILSQSWNMTRDLHPLLRLYPSLYNTRRNIADLDDEDPTDEDINVTSSNYMDSNILSYIFPLDMLEIPSWPDIYLYSVQKPP